MSIGLYTLTSQLHDQASVEAALMEIMSYLYRQGRKEYFLTNPTGNHHIIFTGKLKELFDAFFCHISDR